jgi:S-adenosylmethionine:tRNA ribosyltransferase-isomerase
MSSSRYTLSDFDYPLPPELIAQAPSAQRTASRLLEVEGNAFADRVFSDLPALLEPGDLLILNDTRVIKARLTGEKPASGGRIEALLERVLGPREALMQIRASHAPRPGSTLRFAGSVDAVVLERNQRWYRLRFETEEDVLTLLERHGELPLPPYIRHAAEASDVERYQTVYARQPGAVAAPTAGLHFDDALFRKLADRGITTARLTLHVGSGTFQPVQDEDLSRHHMHAEWFSLPPETVEAAADTRRKGGRIIAVGTTTLRALESAADESDTLRAGSAETDLFITPGYRFRIVDRLITNFHLPRSTLLMLVSAFAGYERIRAAYRHAVEQRYRFFSYGDAMLLTREIAA